MKSNPFALMIASFLTLIAAGVGFGVRAGVLGIWGAKFEFTNLELGTITGGGLTGFGLVVLVASLITDRIGYKTIVLSALVLHVLSAGITFAATPIYASAGKDATYMCLYLGMFMFAVANGLCEAAINPLIAQLYPNQKTHYLNILHAGWPGGLILGGILAGSFLGPNAWVMQLRWEIPMALFLIPTVIYGIITLREHFPESEVKAAGITFAQGVMEFAQPLLLFLLVLQVCVGYVELGTDSWITRIMNRFLIGQGFILFIYASSIMFVLRFFAGPIVARINPLGLLFTSAVLATIGLYSIGTFETAVAIWIAVTIYGIGKTFFWPTMLGVVGERFPRGGAMTIGAVSAVGALSGGYLGGPGIGYQQDFYATQNLQQVSPETYQRYQAEEENGFLFLPPVRGLNGARVAVLDDEGKELATDVERWTSSGNKLEDNSALAALNQWWQGASQYTKVDAQPVNAASIFGAKMALRWTSCVPAAMAGGYLILILYFRLRGGYRQVEMSVTDNAAPTE